jgi:hypothetical protein
MADNIPNQPIGAVPPKKETGKVQPKKETVRINLPPKPSAAPTIKLPTLPPGGPSAHAPVAGIAPPAPAPRPAAAPVASAPRSAAPAPVTRPVAAVAAAPTVSGLDTILAIVAAVAGLIAVGSCYYVGYMVLQ